MLEGGTLRGEPPDVKNKGKKKNKKGTIISASLNRKERNKSPCRGEVREEDPSSVNPKKAVVG